MIHMCARTGFSKLLGALLVWFFAVPLLIAQSLVSGDISGTVTDPSGAVIAAAKIELKSLERGEKQTTTSNSSGAYRFSLLKPGRYSVTVEQASFRNEERQVTVAVGQVTAANFTLEVGAASTTLEVTAAAPVINVDDANVSTSFDQKTIDTTPNPGGDLTFVAQLAPGVTMNTSSGYGNFTANGLPATSNLFTINGENDMDPFFNINNSGATNLALGLNEIQEATVITNPYSGQYGQQAGAQVNYVTKSGSNSFHGDANYWWNGRILNANDWFANRQGTERPFSNANQWGADLGVPILKNKLFFYANTEGLRFVLPTVQNTFIPSPQFTSAVLQNIAATQPNSLPLYTQLMNVWTHPTSPGVQNAVPVADSCGDIINANGSSNLPGITASTPCALNFSATPGQLSTEWILSARVDQNIGNNDKVFYRYRMDRGHQASVTDPINSAFNSFSNQPQYDGQLQCTHIFNGNMTNQFSGSGNWYSAKFVQDEAKAIATFPYAVFWQGGSVFDQNSAGGVTGLWGSQYRFPQGRNVTQYQFIDDFAMVRGSHSFKVGMNFRRYDVTDFDFFYIHPRLYFNSMLDFSDGTALRYRQWFTNTRSVPIALYGLGMYAQDEWRVTPKLKLTLAMRFEHNSNPVCQTNCFTQFRSPFQTMQQGPDVPYRQNIQTGLHQAYRGTDALNYSPRIGFTWSPFGNDKTVINGGFAFFYDALAQGIIEPAFQSAPNVVDQSVFSQLWADPTSNGAPAIAATSASALQNGFSSGASFDSLQASTGGVFRPPAFTNFAGTFHTPQYQEWNLQVQHAIGNSMGLSLNYFGTHGIYIPFNNGTLNAYSAPGFCSTANGTGIPCGAGFPVAPSDPSYTTISQWSTGAVSNTNGLTVSFTRRLSQGLSFQANYTWSHGLDELSNGGAFPYGNDTLIGQLNPGSLHANNYGNSDYDIRSNFNSYLVWQPKHKFSNPGVNGILSGWSFSGSLFARTGLPYTIMDTNSFFSNLAGSLVIAGQPLGPGGQFGQGSCVNGDSQCFNPNAFVDATAVPNGSTLAYSAYPTQRRNQYRGPGFFNADFSFMRNIPIKEKLTLAFGANFYNVFNHPNFYLPNLYLASGDTTVGKILSTVGTPTSPYGSFLCGNSSPRQIQLSAKVIF